LLDSFDIRERVLENSLPKNTTKAIDSEGYDQFVRRKDSVDHHKETTLKNRPLVELGRLEELIDQSCDLLRRVLMAVVANAF